MGGGICCILDRIQPNIHLKLVPGSPVDQIPIRPAVASKFGRIWTSWGGFIKATPPENSRFLRAPKGWALEKMTPFKYGHFWYQFVEFLGKTRSIMNPNNHHGTAVPLRTTSHPSSATPHRRLAFRFFEVKVPGPEKKM